MKLHILCRRNILDHQWADIGGTEHFSHWVGVPFDLFGLAEMGQVNFLEVIATLIQASEGKFHITSDLFSNSENECKRQIICHGILSFGLFLQS